MSDTTTRGIRVQVRSQYLPERSAPREQQYLFAYHIRVSNQGDETAQLVSREWIINDADGHVERVKGPGVVGEQPVWARATRSSTRASARSRHPSAPCTAAIRW